MLLRVTRGNLNKKRYNPARLPRYPAAFYSQLKAHSNNPIYYYFSRQVYKHG